MKCARNTMYTAVYCPFPGFIDHGKILLVGNMGLYEYRPYVRYKTTNLSTISLDMYDIIGHVLLKNKKNRPCGA